jgi:hypothetical protein
LAPRSLSLPPTRGTFASLWTPGCGVILAAD